MKNPILWNARIFSAGWCSVHKCIEFYSDHKPEINEEYTKNGITYVITEIGGSRPEGYEVSMLNKLHHFKEDGKMETEIVDQIYEEMIEKDDFEKLMLTHKKDVEAMTIEIICLEISAHAIKSPKQTNLPFLAALAQGLVNKIKLL